MKYILRVPIENKPYAYSEVHCDTREEYDEAIADFDSLATIPEKGVTIKEFNKLLDQYLKEGVLTNMDLYQSMSHSQKDVFQAVKKSFKRIRPKDNDDGEGWGDD